MKHSTRQKLNYRFERFISKGGASIFKSLLIVFISGFLLILGLRYILLLLFPEWDYLGNFWDHIWVTFLQMTAPGNMNQDNASPTWLKITTILAGFIGVIILSMLIAFITSSLNTFLYNFRKGRGKVLEQGHTIILGWNDRVVDILKELIIANESEKKASVVILSEHPKEDMDDHIEKRVPDTITTTVITTNGNASSISELKRINVSMAKSIILLAQADDNASHKEKIESDAQVIKSILAVKACIEAAEIPIIAEVYTEEKRAILNSFNDEHIIALDTWNIMGKLLMQTSLTSGLQMVYNEVLSFDGCEVYYYHANWGKVNFFDLAYHFKDGIPIGVYNEDDGLILRPPKERMMKPQDEILILAEDDSTIDYQQQRLYPSEAVAIPSIRLEPEQKKVLILGWHSIGDIYINEADDYLPEGSSFDIMYFNPKQSILNKVDELRQKYPRFGIELLNLNPRTREGLESINLQAYSNIIILSQDAEVSEPDKVDTDTLIILLLLRDILQNQDYPKIITQVLNSENQQLISQANVDDFIISNGLITMVLAQLSEEPRIKLLYDDIFEEEGSEIYVKPAHLYFDSFPQHIPFSTAMVAANERDEVCLGIRKGHLIKDLKENFGVRLNLPKDELIELEATDFLVVLSEDEL